MTRIEHAKQILKQFRAATIPQLATLIDSSLQKTRYYARQLEDSGFARAGAAPSTGGRPGKILVLTQHKSRAIEHALAITETAAQFVATGHKLNLRCAFHWIAYGELVPDLCVTIAQPAVTSNTLAHFIEVDLGTEPGKRRGVGTSIEGKLRCYAEVRRSEAFRKTIPQFRGKGFRVLFIANSDTRMRELCRLAQRAPGDFVWVSSLGRMQQVGINGRIWQRGGQDREAESILPQTSD